MFLLTVSAHWGKRRQDLIRMVPAVFPRPDLIVTITGLLELLGAVGLLLPVTAGVAAACLAALLVAMFSANVRVAQHNLTIGGKTATALPLRTLLQIDREAGRPCDCPPSVRQRQAVQDLSGVAVQEGIGRSHRASGRERRSFPQGAAWREDADHDDLQHLCVHGLSPAVIPGGDYL
jgi:uncharacterized membrane protein